jgi:hypothetical protein
VLKRLSFLVNFGPVESEDVDEEQFDEAMAAQDVDGELFSFFGEFAAGARSVAGEAGLCQDLYHRRSGSGGDCHDLRESAHGDDLAAVTLLFEEHPFDVIFDGRAGHNYCVAVG